MVLFNLRLQTNIFKFRRKSSINDVAYNTRWLSDIKRYKILFFGTDNFSLPSLKKLNENYKHETTLIDQLEVVTSFKATINPVRDYATKENLVLHKWSKDFAVSTATFNLGLVVSFGHLLPKSVIESFNMGMLNIHASLLPKLRGASPIIHAIKKDFKETGVSLMVIKADKFDVGEILAQRSVMVTEKILMPELHDKLAQLGADLLVTSLPDLPRLYANSCAQDNSKASYAPKVDKAFTEIRWEQQPAKEIYNLYRSLYSFKPLLTKFNEDLVKIFELEIDTTENSVVESAGSIKFSKTQNCLKVTCSDGRTINILKLSIGKKKAMSAAEFYNGFLSRSPIEERRFNKCN